MTDPGDESFFLLRWWNGPTMRRRRRWAVIRAERLGTVELGLGALILILWAALATWGVLILTGIVLVLGLWLHVAAGDSGSHTLLWLATGFVMSCMLVAAYGVFVNIGPTSLAVGSLTALVYNELIRLHHARRRLAEIDEEIYVGSAVGMGLIAVFSLVGVGLADWVAGSGSRSWLWMAATVTVLIVASAVAMMLPRRRFPKGAMHRWQAGDRIPPQPLGQFEPD